VHAHLTIRLKDFELINNIYDSNGERGDVNTLLDWAKQHITSLVGMFTEDIDEFETKIDAGTYNN
jgi:hypothetical protein